MQGRPTPAASGVYPSVPSLSLDTLWFQVAGTLCNLSCTHCFISCSPTNQSHGMLTLGQVRERLREAVELGVREYYFTGGEPFLNPELLPILEETLRPGAGHRSDQRPAADSRALPQPQAARGRLRVLARHPRLDRRLLAPDERPDPGEGTFDRILAGLSHLANAGLNPVVTVTDAFEDAATPEGRQRLLEWMRSIGLDRPRLKVLSLFRIGAEASRQRAYERWETLEGRTLTTEELERLQCSSCRMVTSRGVYVCPILLDEPEARMGASLAETLRPFPLAFASCFTCHAYGVTCRT